MYLYLFLSKLRGFEFLIDLHLIRTDYRTLKVCDEFKQFRNITSEFQLCTKIKRGFFSRLLIFNINIPICGWSSKRISIQKLKHDVDKYEFIIVNYVWNYKSVVGFNCKKILFVHDSFLNRNKKVKQKWLSFNLNGLSKAYSYFNKVVFSNYSEYVFESLYFNNTFYCGLPFFDINLKNTQLPFNLSIGFIGSNNVLNYRTLKSICSILKDCRNLHTLKMVVAGSISKQIKDISSYDFLEVIGEIDNVDVFYNQISFVLSLIGPSTGIKIKDIEALAYGKVIVCDDDSIHCFPTIEGLRPSFIHINNLIYIFDVEVLANNKNIEYYTLYQSYVTSSLIELFDF
jgi:hypothetical protein